MEGYFKNLKTNNVIQIFIGKDSSTWWSYYIDKRGSFPLEKIEPKKFKVDLSSIGEKEVVLEWNGKDWTQGDSNNLQVFTKIFDESSSEGYFVLDGNYLYLSMGRGDIPGYWITKRSLYKLKNEKKCVYSLVGLRDAPTIEWNGNSWIGKDKYGQKEYKKEIIPPKEGYFQSKYNGDVIFILLGEKDWKPIFVNIKGAFYMKEGSRKYYYTLNSGHEVYWNGNEWVFEKNLFSSSPLNHQCENYFLSNDSKAFILLGKEKWKSYWIEKSGFYKITQIKENLFQFQFKNSENYQIEFNGKSEWKQTLKDQTLIYKCVNEFENPNPKVKIIGIGGPSGSGKSSISKLLISDLNSPYRVIQADFYFKIMIPTHEKWGRNWETPEAVDYETLKTNLKILKEHLEKSPYETFDGMISSQKVKDISTVNKNYILDKKVFNLYIVIEGFLLFADKELCSMLDYKFFLNVPHDICRERRMKRDKCSQEWYDEMVWKHYLEFRELQLKNSNPIELNGEDPIEKNKEKIIQYIKDN